MGRVTTVSFDMEGTLVDGEYSRQIWEVDIPTLYGEKHRLLYEEARKAVHAEYATIGETRPEWYDVGYWWRRFELPGDWKRLTEERRNCCGVYPEVRPVLERLGKKYRLVVTSNTIREFLDIQLQCVGYPFERSFSAPSDFHEVKKSSDFYSKILRELGVDAGSIAHVGDHREFDYVAPLKLGVRSYHLDRSGAASGEGVVHDLSEFEALLDAL